MKVSVLGLALLPLLAKPTAPLEAAVIVSSAPGILTTVSIKAPRSDAHRDDGSGSKGATNRAPSSTSPRGPQS